MSDSNLPFPSVPATAIPKTLGQILDRTYQLTRAHFSVLVGISAAPMAPLLLAIGALEAVLWIPLMRQWPNPPSPDTITHLFPSGIFGSAIVLITLLSLAITSIYLAAACYASSQADLGIKPTFGAAYGQAWKRSGRYLWLLVLLYLYAFLPVIVTELGFFLAGEFSRGSAASNPVMLVLIPLAVALFIAALVYGTLMGLRLSLAFPACVAENLAAGPAIKRSFQLTRGAKGRIFLVILVIYAALYAAITVAEIVIGIAALIGVFIVRALHIPMAAPWSYIGLGLLGVCALALMLLFIALPYAVLTTALSVLYHDQRLRQDGMLPAPLQAGELV